MVKLGKVFSIIVVFALLIVLAPALVPRAASADPGPPPPPLPNPLTVEFEASIDYIGVPTSFNAVPNLTKGGAMAIQLSRDSVVYTNNLTDCKFYNISAASGTIEGDLCGGIELEWNRLDLAMEYPGGTKYVTGETDGFGLLYIRGNLTTDELGDFKFVGGGDLDYKGSTTKGAGRICTVIPWKAPPDDGSLEQVLIGEITTYTLTASQISGTLNLRYYNLTKGEIDNDWSKMSLDGWFGGDAPDNITAPPNTVDLVQFTQPNLVPTWSNQTAGMEEQHPGGENPLRLISGFLGPNGTVTLNRTGVMPYTHVADMNLPSHSVHLVKMTLDNWVGNDTTKRGKTRSVLAVDMAGWTGETVDQHAYAFVPSYSPGYEGEGYLKGYESFSISLTKLYIDPAEYVVGDYYDVRLKPTPVISSVIPNVGQAGTTFNVTINGKWFLVDPNYHPLNVTFSDPNVTVNSHQMITDTRINANITILGGAGSGASDVSVKKLNVTGTMTEGFGVGSAANLQIAFPAAREGSDVEPFEVKVFAAGNFSNVIWSGNRTTNEAGMMTITGLTPATYDIGIKSAICVSQVNSSVTLSAGPNVVDFTIRSGDCDPTNYVDMGDYSAFSTAFHTSPCDYWWDAGADLDRTNWIDMGDYSMFSTYFKQKGHAYGHF